MIRDEKLRQIRKEAGSKGGNPILVNQKATTGVKQNPTPSSSSSVSYSESKESKKVVGTRIALQDPPSEWIEFCQTQRPDLSAGMTFDSFRDYWVGVAGAKGVKLDWTATWRNWVRNQKATNLTNNGGKNVRINQIGEALQRGLDRIERGTKEASQSFS
jgi:hypothetical protein